MRHFQPNTLHLEANRSSILNTNLLHFHSFCSPCVYLFIRQSCRRQRRGRCSAVRVGKGHNGSNGAIYTWCRFYTWWKYSTIDCFLLAELWRWDTAFLGAYARRRWCCQKPFGLCKIETPIINATYNINYFAVMSRSGISDTRWWTSQLSKGQPDQLVNDTTWCF